MPTPRHTVATAIAVLSCGWTPAHGQGMPPTAVRVDPVLREPVREHRMVVGELRALRRSNVATQEAGLVVELPVVEGQPVRVGDVIARLDSRRLEVRKRELEADELAVASLIEERLATLEWRQRDVELYRSSFERGAANPRELRDAESAFNIALARHRQALRQKEVIQARAELVAERLEDMTIVAPFTGVVVALHTELGQWVGEGDAVVQVVSTGRVEAWLDVPQRFFDAITEPESALRIQLEVNGRATSVSEVRVVPNVDPKGRSFDVIATLDDEGVLGRLTPGMSVKGWVPTGRSAERLTVHADAVMRDDTGPYVYAARAGDGGPQAPSNAVAVKVNVMFPAGDRFVVDAPRLKAGDLIVVEGNERLMPMALIWPSTVAAPDAEGGGR